MRNGFNNFMQFSLKTKILIVFIAIITVSGICTASYIMMNRQVVTTSQNYADAEDIAEDRIESVVEEEIKVAQDTDEHVEEIVAEENQDEEKEVTFKDQKVKIPKSKVAAANSSEDAERNKKTGGNSINQEQANKMFQNEGQHSNGIDVSAHQGRINWAQVAASGVDFAMIRCGFRGQTAGSIYEDAYFKTNVSGATANGIKVGIYFYSTAVNETEALEEAAWVVSKIAAYRITYPVVYDFEDFGAYRCAGVDGGQATRNAQTYLNYISSAGYEPMMYANKNDISTRMSRGSFGCKFWLAHYTTQTDYKGSFNMWQYTSRGSVPGISGNVDMNVAYFSYGNTASAKHTHEYTEVVKKSEIEATCTQEGSRTLRCSCGDTQTQVIPKKEHTWTEWETVTKPTTEKEGLQKRTCSVCHTEETKNVDKLKPDTNTNHNTSGDNNTNTNNPTTCSHEYEEIESTRVLPTCKKDGSVETKCKNCGEKGPTKIIKATGQHSWGDWITEKEATAVEQGLKHRECSVCHEQETEVIPSTGEKPSDDITEENKTE